MYAIVKIAGRQYRITPDEIIEVDRLSVDPGKMVMVRDVMFVSDGKDIEVGTPCLPYRVNFEVIKHDRRPKVLSVIFKRRGGMRRTQGHRQHFTVLRVKSIEKEA